ncbi:MAG: class I SAM-dependent RNA methyltransferase [Pseudomonadota bacterium]
MTPFSRNSVPDAASEANASRIFLVAPPGLEAALAEEAAALGLPPVAVQPGGVSIAGDWPEILRANLWLRGASAVLLRLARFRAGHLSELDKRARKISWEEALRPDRPVRIEAVCKRSRIYHSGAAVERVETALRDRLGVEIRADAALRVLVRIERDVCEISVDASGEPLHKRGFKQQTAKAPLRETLAAPMLRLCGYRGSEPVVDPMCGAGTFPIEAAEIALGLAPGRARRFAFEDLAGFDPAAWDALKAKAAARPQPAGRPRMRGADRDAGAVAAARANAERAGVGEVCDFAEQPVSALERPDGPPGLLIVNPPYGERIGGAKRLQPLYAAFGAVARERFSGWRVGLITSEDALARATGLPFEPPGAPIPHGGLRIRLHRTGPLD